MNRPDPIGAATAIQRAAARPGRSAAVRASAGSGKTRVLVDRFVRLCTEGEHNDVHPRAVLAITFTRKAATEIRERLLGRARELALATDDERHDLLAKLFAGDDGPRPPLPAEEDRAARLYERLLEDPSGLQVGTIHSFCQRILQRFAAEAGIDPHARLIEDREDLLDETLDRLVVEAAADPHLAALALDLGGTPSSVRVRLRPVFGEQMRLDRWLRRAAAAAGVRARPRAPLVPALLAELRGVLFAGADLGDEVREDDLEPMLKAALADFAGPGLDRVAGALDGPELGKLGRNIDNLRAAARSAADLPGMRAVLLTKAGAVRKDFTRIRDAELKERFQQLVLDAAAPVLAALRRLDLVALYRLNRATLELGLRALDILDELKQRDRVIDFGDLEDLACVLMGDQARALSLLFRLEDSLRHVLVDEFQDTNFNQRDILLPFVEDFLGGGAGEGAAPPTVFFVGDLKQSIYGFRGAEPGIFAGMTARLERFEQDVHTLPTNFRSLPAVVDGVGRLFRAEPLVSRLPAGEADHVQQLAARAEAPGEITVTTAYEDDEASGRSGHQLAASAAARIAREVVDGGAVTWEDGRPRPLRWSDILVLYRSRTGVSLYEQAFRTAGIPFEPAGRGMLAASREVQDVLALLRWLVWPEDEVALAAVLRSPIVRLPEAAFQRLLAARGLFRRGPDGRALPPAGLWTTLRAEAAHDPALTAAAARLQDWRADTGFVGCHELLRRIVREGDLPERYAAALGPQARRNLERLYDLALAPELAGTPTVRRFIDLVDKAGRRGGHEEGTPAAGGDGGRVRFLTIHGAKGLEAPVVLLVDADRALADRTAEVRLAPADDATGLVFGARKDARLGIEGAEGVLPPDALQQAGEAAARTGEVEETNLLYVAMTRARDRLYVLGGKGREKEEGEARSPLRRLREAAAAAPDAGIVLDDPAGLERPPAPPVPGPEAAAAAQAPVVAWEPPVLAAGPAVVAPSAAAQDADPGAGSAGVHLQAADHGLRVHLLLQLAAERGSLPPGGGEAHAEAAAVFADPALDWIFRPETEGARGLSEVPVAAVRADAQGRPERITGVIDRLVVGPDGVDVIDYKTNRWGGDPARRAWLTEHYRPQLAAYAQAAAVLFPGRPVRTWLLLTDPQGRKDGQTGLVEVERP